MDQGPGGRVRFLDANVFVYAFYKPRRELDARARAAKERAKDIVRGVSEGSERVVTTVVHLSEAANVLKHGMPLSELVEFLVALYSAENVEVLGVSAEDYLAAVDLAGELGVDPNDALAVLVMRRRGLEGIFSF
ncbi:MAG: type II toxin-antitoxin system VapC family toxin, partial [Candidatus Korarchaeota archaeon]|nr:type II toxin-antitoxin system VapC family toxin [Candidatus Korarchaeota archaeon]